MPSLEKYVQKIHKKLNNERLEEAKIKKYLQELDRIEISLDVLKVTGIGRAVNRYRKHGCSDIGDLASHLVTKWKDLLKQESDQHRPISSSTFCDKVTSRDSSKVDHVNNKHEKTKHKTTEVKQMSSSKFCDKVTSRDASVCETKVEKTKHKNTEIKQISSSKFCDQGTSNESSVCESIVDYVSNKHEKTKHKTTEVRQMSSSKFCDQGTSSESSVCESNVDHVSNKYEKPKHKSTEMKSKTRSTPQLCDVSFGCEPVNVNKHKKRLIASTGAATKMTSNTSPRLELELPPLPSSLSVTNSLLPEIQPSYKPMRLPEFSDGSPKKKKGVVASEIDEHALMSRKSRTQVFSGRKMPTAGGEVTSLFTLSMKILIDNIDALGDTGGVPYDILHPVLEKCNPQQLLNLEECNPYFIDDTEPLWEKHCYRDFKGTKPKPHQTWRKLYMQNETDREARLKKINEKIAASQAAKKPERQVQLAYVMSEAKPPREVRRKQAKYGTGRGVHSAAPVTAPSRSAPQTHHRTSNSSPAKKHPVPAPMMKKTMQLFKTQRSRATTSIKRT